MRKRPADYDTEAEARELAEELGVPEQWGKIDDALCDAYWHGTRRRNDDERKE